MNKAGIAAVVGLMLAGCAGQVPPDNVFPINGMVVTLSPEEMQELRDAWVDESLTAHPLVTALEIADVRWTLDFIALRESKRKPQPCRTLNFEGIEHTPEGITDMRGQHPPAGRFDEFWRLNACGVERGYRVFNPQSTMELAIDEAPLQGATRNP
ncbi:MAG: hypothetical protein COX57_08945 [Alphaproteobacteria bacterium CG_4_10_14_0_2_um_filter_63_37]|nr:MAG: hypothetical protein AUJ55_05085 [Proteobacteria bacterium CG1_02_64_396]PJA24374.1 MAG: hypothetical protein COX57_08945 [Alphaproteobacteria bacterium CG_4_10_14_0_2_um_filter_63_37]